MRRRSGFLLFVSACIPGCGQMYQGYMKRGVSLLGAFCAVIGLAALLGIGELAVFLPLIWLFAFFDAYNLHSQTDEQAAASPDGYLFGLSSLDGEKLSALCRGKHSIIGWCLVALGAYALYNTVVGQLMNWVAQYTGLWWLQQLVMSTLPRLVVTVLVILLGLWFIRGPKPVRTEEEYASFTPPEEQAGTEKKKDEADGTD